MMDGQRRFLALLFLWISAVSGEYLFTLPRMMKAGGKTSFCLLLTDIQEDGLSLYQSYTVTVEIQYQSRADDIRTTEIQTATFGTVNIGGYFQRCQEVEAPKHDGRYSAVVSANLTYFKYSQQAEEVIVNIFGAEKNIEAKKRDLITLVQTDKPLYKPGQMVKFRVMTMDDMLMSKTDGYQQITIESPNGLRVMQWDDVQAPTGLVSEKMQLSKDPVLGSWKIKVTGYGGKETVQSFEVDEYVLPKFEVTVTPPKYLLPTTQQINGTVCAKYTYGKPVKGELRMKLCFDSGYSYTYYAKRPCANVSAEINGCYQFYVDANDIKLGRSGYSTWGTLKIEANVTEAQTGIELYGQSSGPRLSFYPLTLKIEDDSDNYFKPAFPYNGRVVVTGPDGSPAPGEIIRVEGDSSYMSEYLWANEFIADENGIVHFVITEFDKDMGNMNLRASAVVYEDDRRYTEDERYIRTYTPTAYARLTKWYSPSDSYIYIPDIDEAADCDKELELEVLYTAERGEEYKFMTIVKAGDAVVYTEQKNVFADDSTWNLDIISFEESLVLKREMKPTHPPPLPTNINETTVVTVDPEPFDGTEDGAVEVEPVVEEIIVPEIAQQLGEETPRKKRADDCASNVLSDATFIACIMETSSFMSSIDPSDTPVMMAAMCGEEMQCLWDYLDSCPEVLGSDNPIFTGFKMIADMGGKDTLCGLSLPEPPEKSSLVGNFKVTIPVTKDMSPSAKVLVFYIRKDKEVVATSLEFKIKNCFKNQVRMAFDKTTVRPGTDVTLNLGASPSSTCFVGMVDKSVTLLGGNNQVTPDQVFERVRQVARPYHYISYYSEDREYCNDKVGRIESEDYYSYSYSYYTPEGVDAEQAFREMELWIETDAAVATRPCTEQRHYYYHPIDLVGAPGTSGEQFPVAFARTDVERGPSMEEKEKHGDDAEQRDSIRSYFPETWLWDIVTLGEDGTHSFKTEIPDTITEWIGNTVCTHESDGVGVTELTGVTAFKPFFVSLTLPYSAIRGEILPVLATVFNYLSECITLEIEFKNSEGFEFSGSSSSRRFCLCGGESETEKYHIIPTVIGEIDLEVIVKSVDEDSLCENVVLGHLDPDVSDGVQRQLLVEAEGVLRDQTKSSYTCVSEGEIITETIEMSLPADMVPDSERGTVSVVGDIMGPTLSNLKNLLRMPYGCGEQNMASWTPNIWVLRYLESTNQLTKKIEEEAEGYMRVGYQRQMKYRHSDNSYSAWGDTYGNANGSSWLTAFVVKSMAQSSDYIVVDNEDITRSARWLVNSQLEDGCFPRLGRTFSSYLKGGLKGDNVAGLTAFILIALLEADLGEEFDPYISKGFSACLDSFDLTSIDTYTLTLTLYAYTMYDIDGERRAAVMAEVDDRHINEDGLIFWRRSDAKRKSDDFWWYRASSAEVEMTAYVLTSKLFDGDDVIGDVQPIVQWLTRQRNPYGGFSSTQDTVVALQALAEFARMTYSGNTSLTVEIKNSAMDHVFYVTPSNSLVFQAVEVNPSQGAVEITTTGTGCVLNQVNMKYNVYEEEDDSPAFDVKVRVYYSRLDRNNCARRVLDICASYLKGGVSNMAIAEVKMLTGWTPVTSTLDTLVKSNKIQKYEVEDNYVQLYFDEFSSNSLCVHFEVEQEIEMNPKPSLVRVYDYYEAEYTVTVNYTIKTTCGTKEEIPFDNEGLDCAIMQCRVLETPRIPEKICPSCLDTIDKPKLEKLVCDSKIVYKAAVRRDGTYSIKVMADLRSKRKLVIDRFVNYTMLESCSCPMVKVGSGPETKAFILSTETDILGDEIIRLGGGQIIVPYQKNDEKTIRYLSSRKNLCQKLSRLRRSGAKKNATRLRRLRKKFGVL